MLVIFQILMILWPTAFALASTVNIGDTLNIERGGLGFYTIQYWSDYRDKWMYITYSRTYYTDQDGNKKIAYCMDQDLDGVGWLPGEYENYDALVREELRNDKIWQVLKNGYPNVSPQDLGVETEDDAYLATKQAVYWIIKHGNEPNAKIENIYTHFRTVYEEMRYTMNELKNGRPESECYEAFGRRCESPVYRKFGMLLNQNLRKGTKGLTNLLQREAQEAFEERKNMAKKLGEEAGTKLMIPLFLMLAVVFVIVTVPAFLTIQI